MGAFAAFRRIPTILAGHLPDIIRKTADRMHYIAAFAAGSAFISDFLIHLHPSWMLCISATTGGCATVGVLAIYVGWLRLQTRIAEVIMFCTFTAILSLGVYVAKVGFDLDPFQKQFNQVDDNVERVNKKVQLVLDTLGKPQRTQIYQFNLTMNVPISTLVMLRSQVDQFTVGLDPAKTDQVFAQKVAEYPVLKQYIAELRPADPRARILTEEAETALSQGDFGVASAKIREAATLDSQASIALFNLARARALGAARTFQRSAQVAALALQYGAAAQDFDRAAMLAAPYDSHLVWQLRTEKGDALYRLATERGDQDALGEAADAYRDALSLVSQNPLGPEFIRTRDSLSNTVARLNQIPALAERHRAAIEALDKAGNPSNAIGRNESANGPGRGMRGAGNDLNATGAGRNAEGRMPRSADQLTRKYNPTGTAGRHRLGSTPTQTLTQAPQAVTSAPTQSSDEGGLFGRIKNWVKGQSAQSQATSEPATPSSSASSEIQNAVTSVSGGKLQSRKPAGVSSPRPTSTTSTHKEKKGTGSSN